MLVLGYEIQDPNSPQQKFHCAFALANGHYIAHFGPDGRPGQVRGSNMTVRAAAQRVVDLLASKTSEGYSNTVMPLLMVDVPDGTTDSGVRAAVAAAYQRGEHTEFTMPSGAVSQFVAAANATAPAAAGTTAPITPGARIEDRAESLRLPEGTLVTRPNGETYLPRDLGGHTDIAVLRKMRDADLYSILSGLPGTGKTALADSAFPDMISVQCHGDMTVAHLVGTHLPTPDGGWRWENGPLTIGMTQGRPVYIDEIDKMPDEVSSVLHSAMDGRRMIKIDDRPDVDPVIAADGFYVIAAYNPDALGGKGLTEAMLSRFTVQIEVTTDYAAARALGVPETFVTIAENLATKAAEAQALGGRGVWAPQMRELLAAKRIIDTGLGPAFAAGAMVAACPWPEDLATVTDVATQAIGTAVQPLRLGAQV